MAKLPRDLSGRAVVAAVRRCRFSLLHQKGSHMILRRDDPRATVAVPDHRAIRVGTLRVILHESGLSVDEFIALL